MTDFDLLAAEIGVSSRTLRRAVLRGLVRGKQSKRGRYEITSGERRYVRHHWGTLSEVLAFLRTEPNVRLAVLFGSLARGDARAESDVDLLVQFARKEDLGPADLSLRLSERLGRNVHVVTLEAAENSSLLLADVLREGRVLVDREGSWPRLRRRADRVERRARRDEADLERSAWQTLESLAG
jgi:predicted nucleotidyltransferase